MANISRLVLVTDAWHPQVNGVVTTLSHIVSLARQQGIEVDVIQPQDYSTIPMPFYKEIPLVWRAPHLEERLLNFQPDAIHIATEGPLGWRVRSLAKKFNWPFTTGYHTKFPEYVHKRAKWIPESWGYNLLKRFHQPATKTIIPATSIKEELETKGFQNLTVMSRGVNREIFNPNQAKPMNYARPIHLYVGRIAAEKNLRAFLDLPLEGSKVIVGKGPELEILKKAYPEVEFVGAKKGNELANFYASADVMVFPSLTDTFGVVNIEAIACGTPVAAFPVTGPKDIITENVNGALDEDLAQAINRALKLKDKSVEQTIPQYTWESACEQFLGNLALIHIETEKMIDTDNNRTVEVVQRP